VSLPILPNRLRFDDFAIYITEDRLTL